MPVDVIGSRAAREALLDIYVSIGLHDPAAAERLYGRIEARVSHLADQPRMGPRRPDIRPTTRVLVEAPYLILYETEPDADDGPLASVTIVAVLDGRRDLTTLSM